MDLNTRFSHYTKSLPNLAAAGELINAIDLDYISSFNVVQATPNIAATIATPVTPMAKLRVWVSNTGTVPLTVQGFTINPNREVAFYYDGTNWSSTGAIQTFNGAVTNMVTNVAPTVVMAVGNLFEVSMPANTDSRIRALVPRPVYISTETEYPGGSFTTATSAVVNLTTAFVPAQDNAHVNGEMNIIRVLDINTGRIFRVTTWRMAGIAGNWSGWVEEIGLTTNQILSPGAGISLANGVVSNSNRISASAPMASAQAGTTVTLGALRFRYSTNASGGELQIQSASASAVAFRSHSEEFYQGLGALRTGFYLAGTAPATGATWVTIPAGGLSVNEILKHEIITLNNAYHVKLYAYETNQVHIVVEKAV